MKKILLLEDDYELAQTLKELLESNSYSVDVVYDGEKAIDATYDNRYDLYIFDINVPEISGLELLESLRTADDTTPTLFISAMIDLKTIAKGFAVGADDYIKKPFFPEELLIRVNAKLSTAKKTQIIYKDLKYFPDKKILYKNNEAVSMGDVQKCLCDLFMNNIGDVLDKSVLMDCLTHPSDSALRVALNKLKQITGLPVKNIRSVGYTIEKL